MDPFAFFRSPAPIRLEAPAFLNLLWLVPLWLAVLLLRAHAPRRPIPHLAFLQRALRRSGGRPGSVYRAIQVTFWIAALATSLLFALGPYREHQTPRAEHRIFVLDDSLGTRALGPDGRALVRAVAESAAKLAADAGGTFALATFGGGLQPLGRGDGNHRALLEAFAAAAPRGHRDWAGVISLAADLGRAARVIVVSPFAPPPELLAALDAAEVDRFAVPGARANAGIVALRADQALEIEVRGASKGRRLIVWQSDGSERTALFEAALTGASEREVLRFDLGSAPPARVRVSLVPADAFAADDDVVFALPRRAARVLAVGKGRGRDALLAFGAASPSIARVVDYDPAKAPVFAVDERPIFALLDADTREPWPSGRYLAFASSGPNTPWRFQRSAPLPAEVVQALESDPLLRGLSFADWAIARAPQLVPGEGFEALVQGSSGPLIGRFAAKGLVGIAVAPSLDPAASGLALLDAFPLFLEGAVRELVPERETTLIAAYRAGGTIALEPGEWPELIAESGARIALQGQDDGLGHRLPEETGIYTILGAETERSVSLCWLDHPGRPGDPAVMVQRPSEFVSMRHSARAALALLLSALLIAQWWHRHAA